jgi:XTP/dITP diphosphohydrolase
MALPALSLATKLVHRAEKNGVQVDPVDGDDLGSRLMALVVEARAAGRDPETELRLAARRYAERVRAAER